MRPTTVYVMPTPPSKRRKPSDFKSSPLTVKSLDFFFEKQRKPASSTPCNDLPDQKSSSVFHGPAQNYNPPCSQSIKDEDLARKLQSEWDEEERAKATNSETEETREIGDGKSEKFGDLFLGLEDATPLRNPFSNKLSSSSRIGFIKPETLALQSSAAAEDGISSTIPFDESLLTFDTAKYLPSLKDHWLKNGCHATYGLLTRCFVLVNSTQSRIKIVDTLVNFLRIIIEGDPESLLPAVRMFT